MFGVDDAAAGAIVTAAGTVIGAGTSAVAQSSLNRKTREFNREEAEKQRLWSEKMYNEQNAWNYEMWQKQNEYNTPEAQVERLRAAGLNPLYYGLDGSSAGSVSAAQPLGYERASVGNQVNPFASLSGLGSDIASAMAVKKDIELKNAQIDKLESETHGIDLDNEFKDKSMAARVEAEQLANEISKETANRIRKEVDVMEQDIKKKIAETDNEIEKKSLIQAETALKKASEKELLELLPYRKLLMEAQTGAERAAAAASWAHAAYQNGLIDNGYLDALCEKAKSDAKIAANEEGISWNRARQAAYDADIERWKSSVKNGTMFDNSKFAGKLMNGLISGVSTVSEALGGSLVPLVSAGIVGKGLSSAGKNAASSANPTSSGSYTTLYGPDGNTISRNSW